MKMNETQCNWLFHPANCCCLANIAQSLLCCGCCDHVTHSFKLCCNHSVILYTRNCCQFNCWAHSLCVTLIMLMWGRQETFFYKVHLKDLMIMCSLICKCFCHVLFVLGTFARCGRPTWRAWSRWPRAAPTTARTIGVTSVSPSRPLDFIRNSS